MCASKYKRPVCYRVFAQGCCGRDEMEGVLVTAFGSQYLHSLSMNGMGSSGPWVWAHFQGLPLTTMVEVLNLSALQLSQI